MRFLSRSWRVSSTLSRQCLLRNRSLSLIWMLMVQQQVYHKIQLKLPKKMIQHYHHYHSYHYYHNLLLQDQLQQLLQPLLRRLQLLRNLLQLQLRKLQLLKNKSRAIIFTLLSLQSVHYPDREVYPKYFTVNICTFIIIMNKYCVTLNSFMINNNFGNKQL